MDPALDPAVERSTDLVAGLVIMIVTVALMLHNAMVTAGVFRTARTNPPFILIAAQVSSIASVIRNSFSTSAS